jgi:hypothetical protein
MPVGFNESITGNEIIDSMQGVQRMVRPLPTLEMKTAQIRQVLRLLPLEDLYNHVLSINARRVFFPSDDRPEDYRDVAENVELVAQVEEPSRALKYAYDEDAPIDSLSVYFVNPILVEFDAEKVLGYRPQRAQIAVEDIWACFDMRAA